MQTITAHGAHIPALGLGVFRMSDEEVERSYQQHLVEASGISIPPRSTRTRQLSAAHFRRQVPVATTCS